MKRQKKSAKTVTPLATVLDGIPIPDDAPGYEEFDSGIDDAIAPLVRAMNEWGMITHSCCSGHEREDAYVGFSVRGVAGLSQVVEIFNVVQDDLGDEVFLDFSLNWSRDVANSCDFEAHPDWIALTLSIDCSSESQLSVVAERFLYAASLPSAAELNANL